MKTPAYSSILLCVLFPWTGFSQTAVTAMAISNVSPVTTNHTSDGWTLASSPYSSGTSYTNHYGQTSSGAGVERVVTGFSIGSLNYVKIPASGGLPFSKVSIKRHPSVAGMVINTLYENTAPSGTNNYFRPGYLGGLDQVINSFTCNRGSDNLFANVGSTNSNIERMDLILTAGISATNPSARGILINERNGNDAFKVAPILSLDGSGEVATLGALLNVPSSAWGSVGPSITSTVMSRELGVDSFLRPKQDIGSQTVSGVFITLSEMGIAAGTTIYGVALFPNDVTSAMDLVGLTDVPSNTTEAAGGGLDMMAGGGFFAESSTLPVHFISFNASAAGGSGLLEWKVSNERNVHHYEIERSAPDRPSLFEQIGSLPVQSTGDLTNTYRFTDKRSNAGTTFYRIRQVDNDNGYSYSDMAIVKQELYGTPEFSLFPNPAFDVLHIQVKAANDAKASVSLLSPDGRLMHRSEQAVNAGNNTLSIGELGRFPAGHYFLQLSLEGMSYMEQIELRR